MHDPHDTPIPDLDTMRREVCAWVDAIDDELLLELWRLMQALTRAGAGGDRDVVP
jgi:hypothetical protein